MKPKNYNKRAKRIINTILLPAMQVRKPTPEEYASFISNLPAILNHFMQGLPRDEQLHFTGKFLTETQMQEVESRIFSKIIK